MDVVERAVEMLSPDVSPDGQDTRTKRKGPAAERGKGPDGP